MRMIGFFVCVLAAACLSQVGAAHAQTTLVPGDVAFTGYDSSDSDQFSFVVLRDVAAGTTVVFTDRGWLAAGGLRSGEGTFELTFASDYACGTEFLAVMSPLEVTDPTGAIAGTTSGSGLQLSTSGDQVLAYQGAEPDGTGGVLAALQMNGGWDADATSTNTTALPAGLVDGLQALAIAPETNNARYDCGLVEAEPAVLAAAVNDAASWLVDDAVPFDLSTRCGFACTSACALPDLPEITSPASIVVGQSAVLSVAAGSLGDATQWHWYADGCGETSLGVGSSVEIAPTATTDVFVRGEGGCVPAGPCASATVVVEPAIAAPQTKGQRKCLTTMLGRVAVVAAVQSAEVLKCAKGLAKGKLDSAEDCVAVDARGKVAKARAKVADLAAKKCVEPPDFGYAGPEAAADAGAAAARGVFADVFGVAFDGALLPDAVDRAGARCQRAVALSAKKCLLARLKEVERCAKAGLADGSVTSLDGLAACVGADEKGRIAAACDLGHDGDKKVDAVRKSLVKGCVAAAVTPSDVLPGCAGAADVESAHQCVESLVACRACRAAEAGAGLGATCDMLDDGESNDSCPA